MSTTGFEYEALPGRVVFEPGGIDRVRTEAERLGSSRAAVLAAPEEEAWAQRAQATLGRLVAGRIDRVRQHVPEEVAEAAREQARGFDADLLVSIGGGSTTGLAKAVALTTGLPILAVPTTYAGSEMTPIWGITAGARKTTGRDLRVLPRTVLYDPELTVTLPPALSAASGMNALAHCAEALWVPAANPVIDALAEAGIRALAAGLPRVVEEPTNVAARAEVLLGAYLAGCALAAVGTGLHHKLAHVLGGTFDLPHAEVHAVLLPYTTALHCHEHPEGVERIARALGAPDAAPALWELAHRLEVPTSLAELGLSEDQATEAAKLVTENGAQAHGDVELVLHQAMIGEPPA